MSRFYFICLLLSLLIMVIRFVLMGLTIVALLHAIELAYGFVLGWLFAAWRIRCIWRRSLQKWDE